MIRRKKKSLAITLEVILIVALCSLGVNLITNRSKKNSNIAESSEYEIDFTEKRLIVINDEELPETYNAKNVQALYGRYICIGI